MTQRQSIFADTTGIQQTNINTDQSLSTTAKRVAVRYIPENNCTLKSVRFRVATISGSATANLVITVQPDLAANPGHPDLGAAALDTVTVTPSTGWQTASGFTTALTAGTPYYIVFKNTDGVTMTECSIRGPGNNNFYNLGGINGTWGQFMLVTSTNTGTSWTDWAQFAYIRIGLDNGAGGQDYVGAPLDVGTNTFNVYLKRAAGLRITVPANCARSIAGVRLCMFKNGTPASVKINAYKNINLGTTAPGSVTPDAVSYAVPVANISSTSGAMVEFFFSTPLSVSPGDVVTFLVRQSTDVSTSGNNYQIVALGFDTDANSSPLISDWTPRYVSTTDDSTSGATIVTSSSDFPPFLLWFQTGTPFNTPASSLGSRARIFTGM